MTEQVRIFRHGKYIAGPTGAAWTNILFSAHGSKGLCFMPKFENFDNFCNFSNLAHTFGMDFRYYFEVTQATNWADIITSSKKGTYNATALSQAAKSLFE
ncbi:MAG: glycosyltransferase family 61 protein [Flavobacteriales bacterium]|nr:glycosyltransferase family 61 protein [Flavobacteriales bacterium]